MLETGQRLKLTEESDLDKFTKKTFVFPETAFMAVTAYQNQLVRNQQKDRKKCRKRNSKFADHKNENRLESVRKRLPRFGSQTLRL